MTATPIADALRAQQEGALSNSVATPYTRAVWDAVVALERRLAAVEAMRPRWYEGDENAESAPVKLPAWTEKAWDMLAERAEAMTDEQILAEAAAEGIDAHAEAAHVREPLGTVEFVALQQRLAQPQGAGEACDNCAAMKAERNRYAAAEHQMRVALDSALAREVKLLDSRDKLRTALDAATTLASQRGQWLHEAVTRCSIMRADLDAARKDANRVHSDFLQMVNERDAARADAATKSERIRELESGEFLAWWRKRAEAAEARIKELEAESSVMHDALEIQTDRDDREKTRLASELTRAHAAHAEQLDEEAKLREALDSLRQSITTICDEACGLQPVQSAEDSLTMIERKLFEQRRDAVAADGCLRQVSVELTQERRAERQLEAAKAVVTAARSMQDGWYYHKAGGININAKWWGDFRAALAAYDAATAPDPSEGPAGPRET